MLVGMSIMKHVSRHEDIENVSTQENDGTC
jgi:hypothetical protein